MLIEEKILRTFCEKKNTLSVAESCTGGAIASALTKIPGASDYFSGGIIAYSNTLKSHLLAVEESVLVQFGTVSREVVVEMVEGLLALTQTDWGIAISGIAGPTGGSEEKPIGTVWAAVCHKGELPHCWSFHAGTERKKIIRKATKTVLNTLYKKIIQ